MGFRCFLAWTTLLIVIALTLPQRKRNHAAFLQTTTNTNQQQSQQHLHKPTLHRRQESTETKIPRNMIFTYKTNLLETQEPQHQPFYDNIQNTISLYRRGWNDPTAPIIFLDDDECRDKISLAEPDLVQYFESETNGAYKADMCRVAALYHYGGYYFDIDLVAMKAYAAVMNHNSHHHHHHVDPNEVMPAMEGDYSFVTARSCGGTCFFQAFLASTPHHPILRESLNQMLHIYVTEEGRTPTQPLGPFSMHQAYTQIQPSLQGFDAQVQLLEEFKLDDAYDQRTLYPNLPRQHGYGNCNYIVHDPPSQTVYFFARFVGAGSCKRPVIPYKLWFCYETNLLETKSPADLYDNVQHAVTEYNAAAKAQGHLLPHDVEFLTDAKCIQVIQEAEPKLLPHYQAEQSDERKGEMCITSALYLYGGHAIDVAARLVKTPAPLPTTNFIATNACAGGCFFQGYIASIRNHPILGGTLQLMRQSYERQGGDTSMLGAVSMANAYYELPAREREGDTELWRLKRLEEEECGYVLHDKKSEEEVFFRGRFRGGEACPSAEK